MLLNDTHSRYINYTDRFVVSAFQVNDGKWQGEFVDGSLFQLRYTHALLFASMSETYYGLGHSVQAVGHDSEFRLRVALPEILDYLYWNYDPLYIWYT